VSHPHARTLHSTRRPTHSPVANLDFFQPPSIVPVPYTIIKQGRTTPFPCSPCSTVLIRVASPCMFRHPNWHSTVLRLLRMSTIYQVHEGRQASWCPFLSQQPTLGSLTYPNHVSHRSPNIKLIVRPFSIPLPNLKPIVIALFLFLFGDTWKQTFFHPLFQFGMWAFVYLLLFIFVFIFSFRAANRCV
jgi:hypothetical protein